MKKNEHPRKIIIPNETPMSWNKLNARVHWTKRNDEVNRVLEIVRAYLNPNIPMYRGRVDILIMVYFPTRKKQYDSSNIPAKLYEDGLKGWVIKDDTPRYVRRMSTQSAFDPINPRLEIIITPVQ